MIHTHNCYRRGQRTAALLLSLSFYLACLTTVTTSPTLLRSAIAATQAGDLDTSFNGTGKVTTDFLNTIDIANAMAVQLDGKIIVAGGNSQSFALARYNVDGSLDSTFGSGGKVATQIVGTPPGGDVVTAVAIQSDSKIVAGGFVFNSGTASDFAVARYDSNGNLDNTFGIGGKVTTDFFGFNDSPASIKIQTDGKILVGGYSFTSATGAAQNFALARYTSTGALDSTFGAGGKVSTDFQASNDAIGSLAIQSDGKIIAAGGAINGSGYDFAVARYDALGALDNSFGTNGKVLTDFAGGSDGANACLIQTDGKIVLAGGADSNGPTFGNFALARYEINGTLDTSFGSAGKVTTDFASKNDTILSITMQSDGKIVAAGAANSSIGVNVSSNFALARYNSNGSLDATFGSGGKISTVFGDGSYATAVAVQTNGSIVIAGNSAFFNSPINSSFGDFVVARYTADGSLDSSFGSNGTVATDFGRGRDSTSRVIIQPDGKILAGGGNHIARYNADGTLDSGFGIGGQVAIQFVTAIALQGDGKILALLAGVGSVARYNSDGSRDLSFGTNGLTNLPFSSFSGFFQDIKLQSDGKIVIAGYTCSGFCDFAVFRYNANGSADTGFGTNGLVSTDFLGSTDYIQAIAIQPDNKIIAAGGAFNPSGGLLCALARYNTDGTLDATFGSGGKATASVSGNAANAVVLQPDTKIVVAGFGVARFNNNGGLDTTFGSGGSVSSGFGAGANAVAIQSDGRIVIAGSTATSGGDFAIARLSANGISDSTFGSAGKVITDFYGGTDIAKAIAIQSDGKIIAGGSAQRSGTGDDLALARYFSVPPTNPIDQPEFFVRQHYLDFLNRQADQSGLDFWVGTITSCGSDTQCIDVKRINTSAAFFLSIEFQNTGYLVYRIYKAAYGNLTDIPNAPVPIKLQEFLPDTQTIGNGVIVGQGDWQQQLETNKQAFTFLFVQRTRFISAFPTTLTPTQFVDKLFQNAGVTPSSADRTTAINEFGGAADTSNVTARSKALRDVAENSSLNTQEFNRAFVLMQYFGYLRRNPYDAPEPTLDYQGYNFWLNKLNQFGGSYVNAEMVKSFLVSSEYRKRFGP